MMLQGQHYVLYPEGAVAAQPQQREGFKPLPADDPEDQTDPPATDQSAGEPAAAHTAMVVTDAR